MTSCSVLIAEQQCVDPKGEDRLVGWLGGSTTALVSNLLETNDLDTESLANFEN